MLTTKLLITLQGLVNTPNNGLDQKTIDILMNELQALRMSQHDEYYGYDRIRLYDGTVLSLKDCKNDEEVKNLQEAFKAVRHARSCNASSTFLQSCEKYLATHHFLTPKQMAKLLDFTEKYCFPRSPSRFYKESWVNRDIYGDDGPEGWIDRDIFDVPNC